VLVFEDLHWADDGLLDFVDHLIGWATGVRMLIVATGRPELLSRRPGWGGGKPNALTISLAPLSEAEATRLVDELIERTVMPAALRDAVLDRAQGNPLYAEEFAQLVSERGELDDLPESVQGIIAARLDALPRDEKDLLQDAAVVGKVFWSGALGQMRARDRIDVEQTLHSLVRKEFVRRERRSSVGGETEYAFRHILVSDVAYAQIPRGERAERHVLAAGWIESLGRPRDHAERLAQHYVSAMELALAADGPTDAYADRARGALRDAGDRAMALNAFAAAAGYFGAALELMSSDDPNRPIVLFRYGKARRMAEEAGGDALAEAETALQAAGDLETAGEAAALQAGLAWFAGDGALASAHLARAAGLVEDLPASFSNAYVLSDLSQYHMLAGRWDQSIALGRQAMEVAEELDIDEIRVHALTNIGVSRVGSGDPAGVGDVERALEIGRTTNSPDTPRTMNSLAACFSILGEPRRGYPLIREALLRARELGNTPVARFTMGLIPGIDFDEGSWDEALGQLDAFITEAEEAVGHALEGTSRWYRARIRFARGDLQGATEDAERGLVAGRRAGDPQVLIPALSFMAWLKVRTGSQPEADQLLDEVTDVAMRSSEYVTVERALTLVALRRMPDLERIVEAVGPTRWRELFSLIATGKFGNAAEVAEQTGKLPDAALLRMAEAERLIAEGAGARSRGTIGSGRRVLAVSARDAILARCRRPDGTPRCDPGGQSRRRATQRG